MIPIREKPCIGEDAEQKFEITVTDANDPSGINAHSRTDQRMGNEELALKVSSHSRQRYPCKIDPSRHMHSNWGPNDPKSDAQGGEMD